MPDYVKDRIILAIDQGTTSTRSMSFGTDGVPRQFRGHRANSGDIAPIPGT